MRDEHYIYSEDEYGLIEGPFVYEICKWHNTIRKRLRAVRRLLFRPRGRLRERIVEYPLALAVLGTLGEAKHIADIGGASSKFALEAVYLGHEVDVVDLRECPLRHPRLHSRQMNLFDNTLPDDSFDATVCISVIEHVGLERYGGRTGDQDDMRFMGELRRLTRPGGKVIVSGPYGQGHEPAADGYPRGYRIYDRSRLEALMTGFERERVQFFEMRQGIWLETDQNSADTIATARPVNGIFFAVLRVPE